MLGSMPAWSARSAGLLIAPPWIRLYTCHTYLAKAQARIRQLGSEASHDGDAGDLCIQDEERRPRQTDIWHNFPAFDASKGCLLFLRQSRDKINRTSPLSCASAASVEWQWVAPDCQQPGIRVLHSERVVITIMNRCLEVSHCIPTSKSNARHRKQRDESSHHH